MTAIAIYTEDKFRPAVQDIMQAVFDDFPEVTDVKLWTPLMDRTIPVLVLGVLPEVLPITYIKTLSQKQILSNPAAVTEIKAAMVQLLTPSVFPEMTYKVYSGRGSGVTTQFTKFKRAGVVVVDIETGGDIDTWLPEEMWLLSVAIFDGKDIMVLSEEWLQDEYNKRELAEFLNSGIKLIAHNMKFDFRSLSAQLGVQIRGHLCTLLLHHSINPGAKEHGLKPLCRKYLGAPDWDAGTKEYVKGKYKEMPEGYPVAMWDKYGAGIPVGFEAIPRAILYEYNAYDVYWTWYLYKYFAKAAAGEERIAQIAKFEFEASNLFQDVERTGVAVDLEYLDELKVRLDIDWENAIADIRELAAEAGYGDAAEFNLRSHAQVKKLYAQMGMILKSTGAEVIEDLDVEEGSLVGRVTTKIIQARKINTLKGTYVNGIIKRTHNGIVYPDFLVHGTSTGRLSSRDPNIQNIPRDEEGKISLRQIFIPRDVETRSLVSVDYSQAELRVMACMSEDEYLISLFQPGMPDFFDSLMPTAFPRIDLSTIDKDTKKNMRANLKGVIYGMSYGRRAPAIAKALDMPVREAQSIINNYFRAAPRLYDWRQWVQETSINPEETLVSPFGRYYQAEVVTGRNKQAIINSGLSFLPQSTASDICVTAAMEVHKWAHEYDAFIVATIHDAVLSDVPDIHVEEYKLRVQYEMERAGDLVFHGVVPFATEATHGKSWKGI